MRAYGLFAANPLGRGALSGGTAPRGEVTLAPDESLSARYAVVVHPGEARGTADIENIWQAWSGPR